MGIGGPAMGRAWTPGWALSEQTRGRLVPPALLIFIYVKIKLATVSRNRYDLSRKLNTPFISNVKFTSVHA